MPRPRVPKAKAKATGQDSGTNAARFQDRTEPEIDSPLGDPPEWMTVESAAAWEVFRAELPWLNSSHRSLVEIASEIRGRLMHPKAGSDPVGVQALNLLRQCLGQMGATPSDASKVKVPGGETDNKDPSKKYF